MIHGQERISISNDELFDRPSTSAGILDLSSISQETESQKSSCHTVPAAHLSLSPTEKCIKPCCAVERSDEKFHPNICNGSKTASNNSDHSSEPPENEPNNSVSTKTKGAIQTV